MDSYLFGFVVGELHRCCPSDCRRVKTSHCASHCVSCAREATTGNPSDAENMGQLAGREVA